MINQFKSAAQIASSSLIFDMIGMISLFIIFLAGLNLPLIF
ncbi:MAG: hypothetical protein ACON45_07290 [Paracoccaceae bacterium]